MVGAIEQIEREITALQQAVTGLAQETYSVYSSYLGVLGQVVRQQLVVASYRLCTQAYPESFLQLSLSQRQQLQQTLQQLGQQVEQHLQNCLQLLSTESTSGPGQLTESIEHLEQTIAEELRQISHEANQALQNCDILSSPAVEIVLQVAAKAEAAGVVAGPPNLLTAVVESENAMSPEADLDLTSASLSPITYPEPDDLAGHDHQRGRSTAIVAIYLRLGEIEFADSTVMAWRNRLRKLVTQLTSLQREFVKKQRERTIAEAESAWRASWFDHP